MAAAEAQFPSINLTLNDIISTFSGIRPVIGTGKADPSKEARDHVVWEEEGLLTVTGGKMTTFRLIALDVLKAVRHRIPQMPEPNKSMPVLNQMEMDIHCNKNSRLNIAHAETAYRLLRVGRSGADRCRTTGGIRRDSLYRHSLGRTALGGP